MNILPLAFFLLFAPASGPDADFFLAQAPADPELRIEDAYKWLFHATRGGEHALADETAARKWLDREWQSLGPPQPDEPLWVPLTPDGRIGRLNLRPYRAQGGAPEPLLAAFLASAAAFDASAARFRRAWNALGRSLKRNPVGRLTYPEWQRLDREMRPGDFPAAHHSSAYERARQPAYRVLTAAEARKLLDSLPAD